MNLYADTSALIKGYIQEASSEQVAAQFDQHPIISTEALTLVEVASAMANAVQPGWMDEADMPIAWQNYSPHWPAYTRLPLSAGILESATSIAWQHGLRAYEAIQLAARWFGRTSQAKSTSSPVLI